MPCLATRTFASSSGVACQVHGDPTYLIAACECDRLCPIGIELATRYCRQVGEPGDFSPPGARPGSAAVVVLVHTVVAQETAPLAFRPRIVATMSVTLDPRTV
jgi:hypothetical protein